MRNSDEKSAAGNGNGQADEHQIEEAADATAEANRQNFGGGKWFWPKSWEAANPNDPYADLKIGPAYLLDAFYSLVSRKQNWEIAASNDFLVKACHGKIRERSIRSHLKLLKARGMLAQVGTKLCVISTKHVPVFLVNPWLMGGRKPRRYQNYAAAAKLIAKRTPIAPQLTPKEQIQLLLKKLGAQLPETLSPSDMEFLAKHSKKEKGAGAKLPAADLS